MISFFKKFFFADIFPCFPQRSLISYSLTYFIICIHLCILGYIVYQLIGKKELKKIKCFCYPCGIGGSGILGGLKRSERYFSCLGVVFCNIQSIVIIMTEIFIGKYCCFLHCYFKDIELFSFQVLTCTTSLSKLLLSSH